MRKKLFTLLLAIVASLGFLFAESGTCGENLAWDLTNGVLTISGTGAMTDYTSYSSVPWSSCRPSITSVIISDGVTSIENYAFSNCTALTSITIPNSVTSIGNDAFRGCTGLTSVGIGNSVTSIGGSAFEGCSSLTAITIPNSVTSIGSSAFSYCTALTSITIPNSVTSIGERAFYSCTSLTSITIPNSVTSIRSSAFYNVPNIVYNGTASGSPWGARSVNGVVDGYLVYADAPKTTLLACSAAAQGEITIPNSVTSIGSSAFYHCTSLTSITIPNSVTSIGNYAFYECSGLKSVTIGNSVTSIGNDAFSHCTSLTSITIPNSVTSIGSSAFYKCTALTSITIPNSVTSIGYIAFSGCSSLTSITIPNSVTSIGDGAFSGCSGLTSVTIGNSVTSIGSSAFYECTALTSITIPNSVTSIGSEAFYGCRSLPVIDNIRYADTYLVAAVDKSLSTYTIKQGTMWIGNYAFSYCTGLTSITIPNSVTSIEYGAFSNCTGLTSITIPNSVTSIRNYAFSYCTGLTSITIPNSVTSIGYGAFSYCTALTSITIPNSVTSIRKSAFYDCSSLTSIIIPNSVTSIESEAFYGCSNLNIIYSVPATRPTISYDTFKGIASDAVVYVSNDAVSNYKSSSSSNYWASMNIIGMEFFNVDKSETATSVTLTTTAALWEITASYIVSIGVEGGEQQPGNTLEYIGLEPESEYKDVPIVLTSNTGETETVNVSFTTTTLELTTKASKPVSSTTAILLAETNMSDAEVSCGFEYKRNDAPADMDGTKVFCPVASGQMAGRLKNLKDDVYYKYRAFYQSAAGNMYYGDWQYIFTGDVAVEFDPILYTYGATVVRENEATISGYALAGSEDFTEQGFEYWAESRANNGVNAPRRMPAALNEHFFVQASGISLRVTLNNLDAGTVYKYRVYGKVGDQYYYGSEQTFTTQGTYTPPTYTITFANWDGTELQSSQVTENEMPEYTGATPERPEDEQYTYSFNGWTPTIVIATADATYTATYTATPKSQGIEEVPSDQVQCTKVIRNGQIYIIRGDKTYTLQGQEVK